MIRFRGLVHRAHNPLWSFSPTSGEGAKRHGGRFNPKGVAALYSSLTPTVALAEYHQGFPHRPQPTTLCAYQVDCERIVDLTDAATLSHWEITYAALSSPWELLAAMGETPPSWEVARRLIDAGVAGAIVPTYAANAPAGGKNLVFWRWEDDKPHQLMLIDDDGRLPKNPSSWA